MSTRCCDCTYCDFENMKCIEDADDVAVLEDSDLGSEDYCDYFEKGENYKELPVTDEWSEDEYDVWVYCPRCKAKKYMTIRAYLFRTDGVEYHRCISCGKLFGVKIPNDD